MKNALIASGLVLAGFVMVPSMASAMCVGAGNICVDTLGNSGYQQYQPSYGQQYGNRSNKQPQAITFPTYNTTFPSYIPSTQYGSQYQYGYQQYPYNYGYQNAAYYYPAQQYSYNTYGYGYEEYYEDYYDEYYGSTYGSSYGGSTGCGYSQGGAYYCY